MEQENQKAQDLNKWKTRAFKVWTVIGAVIILLAILKLCGILSEAVVAIVVTALTVFLLHGIVDRLEEHKVKRPLGAAIALLGALIIILGGIALMTPSIISQISSFIEELPKYAESLENFAYSYLNDPSLPISSEMLASAADKAQDWFSTRAGTILTSLATGIWGGVTSVGSGIVTVLIALIAAYWILIDLPKMSVELRNLFSEEHQGHIDVITQSFGKAIYGWAKSTIICAIISGIVSGVALWICGVPYSTTLGIICGVTYIIPYLGHIIAGVVIGVIALTVSPWTCIISLVVFIVLANLIGNLVSPRLMKETVNVHPAIILIALLIGSGLAGAIGMFAAIPVAAAIQSIFVSYFEARTGKKLYTKDGALFQDRGEKIKDKNAKTSQTLTNLKLPKKKKK
jgi:predicted PurR-regulated permease PerM